MDSDRKDAKRRAAMYVDSVRAILMRHWDPIGVKDEPLAVDEYDDYARVLAGKFLNGIFSREEAHAYLLDVEENRMGLKPAGVARIRETVRALEDIARNADRHAMFSLQLVPAADKDFEVLGAADVADAATISHVRRITAKLLDRGEIGTWIMMLNDELVGMIGFHAPPDADGVVEIGYNVAPARWGKGTASAALARLLTLAREDARIRAVVAETDSANIGSQRVLERNGFTMTERIASDEPSGTSFRWRRDLR